MIGGVGLGERWAVIGDIHSNIDALHAAWQELLSADRVIVLGDILTYGAAPEACMASLAELVSLRPVDLVLGNHEQLYIDLLAGDTRYFDGLPDWLREAADWTAQRVEPCWFHDLPWQRRILRKGLLIAHANPWAYGDWRYLNSESDYAEAAATLVEEGASAGLFGHTHRAASFANGHLVTEPAGVLRLDRGAPHIFNPGSLGQSRTPTNACTMAWLTGTERGVTAHLVAVPFDVAAHRARILDAGFSEGTVVKLLSYLPG